MKNRALNWILARTKEQKASLVWLIISNGLLSVCVVAFAAVSKLFLDKALGGSLEQSLPYAAVLAFTVVLQIALRFAVGLLSEKVAGKIDMAIKERMFKKVLCRRLSANRAEHTGELNNRLFSDSQIIADGVASILPSVVAIVTRLLAVFAVLIIFDAYLIIACAIMGALLFGLSRLLRGKIKELHKRLQKADGKVRASARENLDNQTVIKAYKQEEAMAKWALLRQKEHYSVRMKRARLNIFASSGFVFFFRTAYMAVLVYCGIKLAYGDASMTFGTLTALLQMVSQVQQPFSALSGIMPRYYTMTASAERLMELEEQEEPEAGPDTDMLYSRMSSIDIENVSFTYGREAVFSDASAKIQKNSFTLITGETGIGKSTLFSLMLGYYPYEGVIKTDMGQALTSQTRGLFAYVPQGNMLFSSSVHFNLTFGASCDSEKEEEALRLACAWDFVQRLPHGIHTDIGQEGNALSEGQAQRLALARAILSKAPILLLDEATSALDEQTEREVLNNLKSLKDRTVILISHKAAASDVATCHLHVQNGKIIRAEGKI